MSKRLSQLLKKREQLSAQIQKIRAREATQKRKEDTRRKILLGALVMEMMDKGELNRDKIWKRLDSFLTRELDRKLFALPLLKTLTIPDRDVGQAVLPTSCVPVGRRSLAGSQTFECRNPTDNQKCRLASHQA